jgi:ATP-dependent Clp protease protease subunit
MSRAKLSRLMDAETWMDATKAVELGFADDIISREEIPMDDSTEGDTVKVSDSVLFSRRSVNSNLMNKLEKHYKKLSTDVTKQAEISAKDQDGVSAQEIRNRLDIIKKYI